MKFQFAGKKKAGTQQLSDSRRAPVFSWVQRLDRYTIEEQYEILSDE